MIVYGVLATEEEKMRKPHAEDAKSAKRTEKKIFSTKKADGDEG